MRFSFDLENIKYIKISCKDSSGNLVVLKSGIKEVNHRNILVAAKYEEDIIIPPMQEVAFNIVCVEGLYTSFTKLVMIEYRDEYIYLTLELPESCEYHQNREYFRVPAKYPCEYTIEKDNKFKTFKTETDNISANGVSIYMPILEISETCNKLKLNINGKEIEIKVNYIRSEKTENGYNISFFYNEIKESDRDIISKECITKQLEARRKSSV